MLFRVKRKIQLQLGQYHTKLEWVKLLSFYISTQHKKNFTEFYTKICLSSSVFRKFTMLLVIMIIYHIRQQQPFTQDNLKEMQQKYLHTH